MRIWLLSILFLFTVASCSDHQKSFHDQSGYIHNDYEGPNSQQRMPSATHNDYSGPSFGQRVKKFFSFDWLKRKQRVSKRVPRKKPSRKKRQKNKPRSQSENTNKPAQTLGSGFSVNIPPGSSAYIEIDINPKVQSLKYYDPKNPAKDELTREPLVDQNGNPSPSGSFDISSGENRGIINFKNKNSRFTCRRTLTSNSPNDIFTIDTSPGRFAEVYSSKSYSGATMYNSMFFGRKSGQDYSAKCDGRSRKCSGFAMHGVDDAYYKKLGTPASGGCIRLTQGNSKKLFNLVTKLKGQGRDKAVNVRVIDTSTPEEKALIQQSCEDDKKILSCVRHKIRGFYGHQQSSYSDPETNPEVETDREREHRENQTGLATSSKNYRNLKSLPPENDYPKFITHSSEYDHQEAMRYFQGLGNKFTYTLRLKQVRLSDGSYRTQGFRNYHVPVPFRNHLIKECQDENGGLVLNRYSKEHPYTKRKTKTKSSALPISAPQTTTPLRPKRATRNGESQSNDDYDPFGG